MIYLEAIQPDLATLTEILQARRTVTLIPPFLKRIMKFRRREPLTKYFVYRTVSGETIWETETEIFAPQPGATVELPSASNPGLVISYTVTEVVFVPRNQDEIEIYIEVEPT